MGSVASLLYEARTRGEVHHASLCVMRDGQVLLSAGDTATYDIASVTKAFTAVAVLQYFDPVRTVDWLLGGPSIEALLSHASGLPAWRPLFAHAAQTLGLTPARLAQRGDLHRPARDIYRSLIAATPATAPRPTYSDLGFLALGFLLEDEVAPLSMLLPPLAGEETYRQVIDRISTGAGRPRMGNPAVESEVVSSAGLDPSAIDTGPDDDNAACAGGLCGHAGLFATAHAVAAFGDRLRRDAEDGAGGLLPVDRARRMFDRQCGDRTLGLDTPSGRTPSIGTRLGRGPLGAAGHLGFTGCSLWIDRDARLSIALLTDAVARARPSPTIRALRVAVHDAVVGELGLG